MKSHECSYPHTRQYLHPHFIYCASIHLYVRSHMLTGINMGCLDGDTTG